MSFEKLMNAVLYQKLTNKVTELERSRKISLERFFRETKSNFARTVFSAIPSKVLIGGGGNETPNLNLETSRLAREKKESHVGIGRFLE